MLSGDNSIPSRAGQARDKTEFAKVQEEIALAQAETVGNHYLGGSSQTIEAQVLAKLTSAGYTIGSENSGTIQDISLSSNSVTVEEGGNTAEVTATLNTSGGSINYVLIKGLYYPLTKKANGDIELGENGKKTLEESTVTLNDITLNASDLITATLDSNTGKVTIKSDGNVTADENGTIKLQNNGTDYATINVAVKKVSLADITPATATTEIGKTTNLSVVLADYQKGTVTWSVTSGGSYASVPLNFTGTSVAVTGDAVGTATITATYKAGTAEVSKTRNVKVVTEVSVIGDYVNYNVPYTDMYSDTDTNTEGLQGYNFTATNGWRILSRTKNATDSSKYDLKIISTGVPAKLYYHYNPSSTETENNNWWGTTAQVNSTYGLSLSSWTNSGSGYYAAYGLSHSDNFKNINFDNDTTQSTKNKGCWQSVAGNTSGTGANFIVSGFASGTISVHNLTLAELNTARKISETSTTSTATTDGDTGLFYLRNLATENSNFGYTSSTICPYWLGSPSTGSASNLYLVPNGGNINISYNKTFGVRPVVSISGVTMTQNQSTGVWTITQ